MKVVTVNTLCVYDILNCDSFVVLKDAAKKIEEVYHNKQQDIILSQSSLKTQWALWKEIYLQVAKTANKIEIAKAVEEASWHKGC
ncbi:MAG: hypothetical protein ACLS27_04135 [Eubacterium sp.]